MSKRKAANGSGTLKERKDGRWEARYVKEITADGKKKYGSVYADSYRAVKEKQQYQIILKCMISGLEFWLKNMERLHLSINA